MYFLLSVSLVHACVHACVFKYSFLLCVCTTSQMYASHPQLAKNSDIIIDIHVSEFCNKIFPFVLLQVLDDPCGNSFIENPFAPSPDPMLSVKYYSRTGEQDTELGIKKVPPNESV